MTGRVVDLPAKIERVACLEVLCYQKLLMLGAADRAVTMTITSAPWMAIGNPRVDAIEKIPSEPNFEDLLLKRVDIVFFAYNADRTMKKLASLGIPALVSQPLGRTAATSEEFVADAKRAVHLFGQVLGGEAERRAEDWCNYLDDRVRFVAARLSALPAGQRPKLYYLRGPRALSTQGMGSNTFWYGEMAGADMVVKDLPLAGRGLVSMEDIVRWNPDVILVGRQYPLDLVLKDERWADIAAVRNGRVISSPEGVFYWDGGPEGVLLMEFLAKLLHPEWFTDVDMAAEVKDYYARFYGFHLSDDQAAMLLRGQSPDGSRANAMNN
jgi:iron complex transport system substrate-binding protein